MTGIGLLALAVLSYALLLLGAWNPWQLERIQTSSFGFLDGAVILFAAGAGLAGLAIGWSSRLPLAWTGAILGLLVASASGMLLLLGLLDLILFPYGD